MLNQRKSTTFILKIVVKNKERFFHPIWSVVSQKLCKEVKEKYPSIFIPGLSTFNQESFISKMMDNGSSGYVVRNAAREELMEAIETVMTGKVFRSL